MKFVDRAVAETFAYHLGVKLTKVDATTIAVLGDLSAAITARGVVYMSNIHSLKKPFVEKLERDLPHGEYEVLIGSGAAARSHKIDISSTTLIGSCPTKYECPLQLLRVIEYIFEVEPAILHASAPRTSPQLRSSPLHHLQLSQPSSLPRNLQPRTTMFVGIGTIFFVLLATKTLVA